MGSDVKRLWLKTAYSVSFGGSPFRLNLDCVLRFFRRVSKLGALFRSKNVDPFFSSKSEPQNIPEVAPSSPTTGSQRNSLATVLPGRRGVEHLTPLLARKTIALAIVRQFAVGGVWSSVQIFKSFHLTAQEMPIT